MRYHVELSPRAEQDIRAIGATWRRGIAYAIRGVLGDPEGDAQHFEIIDPLKGVVVGNVVAIFSDYPKTRVCGWRAPDRAGPGRREAEWQRHLAD
jgi:hypothetical protein